MAFAAILLVKLLEMFAAVISLKYVLLENWDIFVNKKIEFYLNYTINRRFLTAQIMPCYTHKMAIVSWWSYQGHRFRDITSFYAFRWTCSSSVQFARRERVLIFGCLCKRIGVHAGVVGRDCARRGSRDMTTPTEGHVIELDAMTSSTADRALTGYDVITNDAIQVDTAHKS